MCRNFVEATGFGGITSETDSSFRGRYAWTGREIDTEINLQYNRARYYDAGTGRWISQDALGFDAGDGNLYRYVFNSPTRSIDPAGYQPAIINGFQAGYKIVGGAAAPFPVHYNVKIKSGWKVDSAPKVTANGSGR